MAVAAGRRVSQAKRSDDSREHHLSLVRGEEAEGHLQSPLFLAGWLEFNRQIWYVRQQNRCTATGKELPSTHAVLNLEQNEERFRPNLNPYLPVAMVSTNTSCPARQWLDGGTRLAEDMRAYSVAEMLPFPPDIHDVRPGYWRFRKPGFT